MESIKVLIVILLSSVLVDNYVLNRFLGICPFVGVSKKYDQAVGMGVAVTAVMLIASAVTWPIQYFVLDALNLGFLQNIAFILVIATLVQSLELLLKRAQLHVHAALGGAHLGGSANQASQFIHGEENLLHKQNGLHVAAQAVAVGADGVNHFFRSIHFCQQLGSLLAVLLRVHLKVHIMQQTAQAPEGNVFSVLLGKPAHNTFHGQRVLNVKGFFVVLLQKIRLIWKTLTHILSISNLPLSL